MNHSASPAFWECYKQLPDVIRTLADKNFLLLKANPNHPALHFKKVGRYRSARVGRHFRALAVETDDGRLWFSTDNHAAHDHLIGA